MNYRSLERKINELKLDMPEVEEEPADIPEGLIHILSACLDVYASVEFHYDGFNFREKNAVNEYINAFFDYIFNLGEFDLDPVMLDYVNAVWSELSEEDKEIFLIYVSSELKGENISKN